MCSPSKAVEVVLGIVLVGHGQELWGGMDGAIDLEADAPAGSQFWRVRPQGDTFSGKEPWLHHNLTGLSPMGPNLCFADRTPNECWLKVCGFRQQNQEFWPGEFGEILSLSEISS